MTESIWLPGLLALGLGLAGGLAAAWKLRRAGGRGGGSKKAGALPQSSDRELRIRDLEARRDELYDRLRRADAEGLAAADRQALERAAARALRDLDRLGKERPAAARATAKASKSRKKDRSAAGRAETAPGPAPPAPEQAARPAYAARHPFLVGFLFGVGLLGLVGILIYWAVQDAQPDPMRGASTASQSAPQEPHTDGEVPPEVAQRLVDLEKKLADDPGDLLTRKQLALTQLGSNQFFPAFEHATEILRVRPEDPDGLYIQGVVRLTMGRNQEAIGLLDRVLANYPSHLQAMLYRGLALFQDGRQQQAIETWETGLEMAGGSHPGFEQLLGMASGDGTRAALGPPPGNDRASSVAAAPPAAAAPPPEPGEPQAERRPTAAGAGYPIRIELQPGATADPDATLFVILRGGPGPPVAVRRLSGARFPLELVLGQDDSMMGDELPASGTLTVRLDVDGSASTTGEGDLAASAPAERGQATRLVLQ